MTSIPYAYRRGAIYWYRRVLYLFRDRKIVVRLSLRTAEPSQARQRSSALSGATAGIKVMIENQFKHARNLGTSDLEAIGKQAYEEKLAGIQTAERLDPTNVDAVLRPVWLALHDLSQLVIENGGRAVEVDQCEGSLRCEAGFDDVRLTNLCNVADLTANGDGILNEHQIDPLIKDRGFAVNERNRRAARLASLPRVAEAYRAGAIRCLGRLGTSRCRAPACT